MRSFEPHAVAIGRPTDLATGEPAYGSSLCAYEEHGLCWTDDDTHNLEHHNLELDPRFVKAALKIVDGVE